MKSLLTQQGPIQITRMAVNPKSGQTVQMTPEGIFASKRERERERERGEEGDGERGNNIGMRKKNCINEIGHILRRNCLLKQVIEGKIKREMEVAKRRGKRRKKLLDDLKDRKGYSHLKEEALDRTMWRHRFGGGFGPVVRQNTG